MALYDAYSEGQVLPPGSALGKEIHGLADAMRARAMGERESEKSEGMAGAQSGGKRWFSFFQKSVGLRHAVS